MNKEANEFDVWAQPTMSWARADEASKSQTWITDRQFGRGRCTWPLLLNPGDRWLRILNGEESE